MEFGLSIVGIIIVGLFFLALFSAITALLVVLGLVLGVFIFGALIFQNIEVLSFFDLIFLLPLAGLSIAGVAAIFGLFTILPFRIYRAERPALGLRFLNISLIGLIIFAGIVWFGVEKIIFIQENFPNIAI